MLKIYRKLKASGGTNMGCNRYRGGGFCSFKPGFNPKPQKVFRFKVEKILGSLYLTKPLLERMNIKAIIDSIRKRSDCNDRSSGESPGSQPSPSPFAVKGHCEDWAELCGFDELYGVKPENLNDDRLGRALEELDRYFEEIEKKKTFYLPATMPWAPSRTALS